MYAWVVCSGAGCANVAIVVLICCSFFLEGDVARARASTARMEFVPEVLTRVHYGQFSFCCICHSRFILVCALCALSSEWFVL